MRFLVDAQLPPGLVRLFREAGLQAVHVTDVGLLNAGDNEIRAYAVSEGMIVVTKDEDFAVARRLSASAPAVMWVRIGNATNRVLMERLRPVLAEVLDALAGGEPIVEVG